MALPDWQLSRENNPSPNLFYPLQHFFERAFLAIEKKTALNAASNAVFRPLLIFIGH